MANGNPKECTIEEYFEARVLEVGGGTRRIAYRGRRGCADQLAIFKFNRFFLVELKRPKGGKISIHQDEDAKWLLALGVRKEYLHTKQAVDTFIARMLRR